MSGNLGSLARALPVLVFSLMKQTPTDPTDAACLGQRQCALVPATHCVPERFDLVAPQPNMVVQHVDSFLGKDQPMPGRGRSADASCRTCRRRTAARLPQSMDLPTSEQVRDPALLSLSSMATGIFQ
jgi:hypothetical protein